MTDRDPVSASVTSHRSRAYTYSDVRAITRLLLLDPKAGGQPTTDKAIEAAADKLTYRTGDDLLEAIDKTIRNIIDIDLPMQDGARSIVVGEHFREMLVGHLTGAVFVTVVGSDVNDRGAPE